METPRGDRECPGVQAEMEMGQSWPFGDSDLRADAGGLPGGRLRTASAGLLLGSQAAGPGAVLRTVDSR